MLLSWFTAEIHPNSALGFWMRLLWSTGCRTNAAGQTKHNTHTKPTGNASKIDTEYKSSWWATEDYAVWDSLWSFVWRRLALLLLLSLMQEGVAVTCIWLNTVKVSVNKFTLVSRLTAITWAWGTGDASLRPQGKTPLCTEWVGSTTLRS